MTFLYHYLDGADLQRIYLTRERERRVRWRGMSGQVFMEGRDGRLGMEVLVLALILSMLPRVWVYG